MAGGATIDLDFELALMSGAKRALNTLLSAPIGRFVDMEWEDTYILQ